MDIELDFPPELKAIQEVTKCPLLSPLPSWLKLENRLHWFHWAGINFSVLFSWVSFLWIHSPLIESSSHKKIYLKCDWDKGHDFIIREMRWFFKNFWLPYWRVQCVAAGFYNFPMFIAPSVVPLSSWQQKEKVPKHIAGSCVYLPTHM